MLTRFNSIYNKIIKENSDDNDNEFTTAIDNSLTEIAGEDAELGVSYKSADNSEITEKYLCIICRKYIKPEKNNGHLTCPRCGLNISRSNF